MTNKIFIEEKLKPILNSLELTFIEDMYSIIEENAQFRLLKRVRCTYENDPRSYFDIIIEDNKITRIKLQNLGIKDLPNSIANLKALKGIFWISEELNQIPKSLFKIKNNLENLCLSGIGLTKMEGVQSFKNLKTLSLGGNKISKIEGLETLTELKELSLNGNQISRIENLDTLQKLESLFLKYNQINKIEGLEQLISLNELDITKNNISIIEGLGKMKNLKKLNLNENLFSSKIQERFGIDKHWGSFGDPLAQSVIKYCREAEDEKYLDYDEEAPINERFKHLRKYADFGYKEALNSLKKEIFKEFLKGSHRYLYRNKDFYYLSDRELDAFISDNFSKIQMMIDNNQFDNDQFNMLLYFYKERGIKEIKRLIRRELLKACSTEIDRNWYMIMGTSCYDFFFKDYFNKFFIDETDFWTFVSEVSPYFLEKILNFTKEYFDEEDEDEIYIQEVSQSVIKALKINNRDQILDLQRQIKDLLEEGKNGETIRRILNISLPEKDFRRSRI